ncbi:hypothetical protein J6590_004388 [Homalodisca vitripennis]|nr:hypothetical protein J6590_004388 [Homalodisca vitripennis]
MAVVGISGDVYLGYRKIAESSNVERGCCLDEWPLSDPALASRPPARPLVVVRKSPLSRWSPGVSDKEFILSFFVTDPFRSLQMNMIPNFRSRFCYCARFQTLH